MVYSGHFLLLPPVPDRFPGPGYPYEAGRPRLAAAGRFDLDRGRAAREGPQRTRPPGAPAAAFARSRALCRRHHDCAGRPSARPSGCRPAFDVSRLRVRTGALAARGTASAGAAGARRLVGAARGEFGGCRLPDALAHDDVRRTAATAEPGAPA